ncbi:MAG: HAD family phosphatase [Planctomycetota bacterium]
MEFQPKSPRAVAFDMDGTMFNTEDLYDEVGDILLQRRGFRFDRELKLKMMGLPGAVAFQVMREHHQLDDPIEQLQTETREIFADLLPGQIEAMPGLFELLDFLEKRNIPKCVATSSHRQFASTALGTFELEDRFEFVLTAEDVESGKPHPEIYFTAANRFGIDATQMLVLEDSFTGSTAAVAAGALTIAVPTEHSRGVDFSHVHSIAGSLNDEVIFELLQ